MTSPTTATRLWAKIAMGAPDDCWEWQAARVQGYGRIQVGTLRRSQTKLAHRVAYALAVGPIPEGLDVLHRCDHPPCCNPAHLFLGTDADNVADKMAKGRQPRGETHHSSVLSDAACLEVQGLVRQGWVQQDIADAYGICQQHVSHLKRGTRRGDVLSPV